LYTAHQSRNQYPKQHSLRASRPQQQVQSKFPQSFLFLFRRL
jgi:hypothetical protein